MNDFMPHHWNTRGLSGWKYRLDQLGFSRYEWFRKWCGGHWELWYIDVIHSQQWVPVNLCIYFTKDTFEDRPPLATGRPICEHHHTV